MGDDGRRWEAMGWEAMGWDGIWGGGDGRRRMVGDGRQEEEEAGRKEEWVQDLV